MYFLYQKFPESADNEGGSNLSSVKEEEKILSLFALNENKQIENIAIGVFDGIHLGHQKILRNLLSLGSKENSLVITFEPHPLAIISPERVPPKLVSLQQKKSLFEIYGLKHILFIRFDQELRELTAEAFLIELKKIFPRLKRVVVGEDFRFGWNAEGNVRLLREKGYQLGFETIVVAPLMFQGQSISSTKIRKAIERRDFSLASQLLGRSYRIEGIVGTGQGVGKTIGFPTANLQHVVQFLPPPGVYGCQVAYNKEIFIGVANYGRRPTIQEEGRLNLELHLIDFEGNLYGQTLSLFNFHFLREEKKFLSVEELKQQIAKDIEKTKSFFL